MNADDGRPELADDVFTEEEHQKLDADPSLFILGEAPKQVLAHGVAWNCKYRGDYHRDLLRNINALERSENHANCISLIQSSGSGKSRMVDEMAKLVFTIPINLRNPEKRRQGVYPPEDHDIWRYLCEQGFQEASDVENVIALFFQNLFSEVTAEVEHVFCGREITSPGDSASRWRNHLSKHHGVNRSKLYERVIRACEEAPRGGYRFSMQLWRNLNSLLATLDKFCAFPVSKKNDVKIILYFDEAQELCKDIDDETLYDTVRSTLIEFQTPDVFTVFLSTQLSVASSSQLVRAGPQLVENVSWGPVTEMPFDCHPSLPLRPGKFKLADLGNLEFLMRFGKPLFWTMPGVNKGHVSSKLIDDMMNLARTKLLFNDTIDEPDQHSDTAMLVILDVLITIDYELSRELTHDLHIEMVANHLRTAFSVPDDCSYMHSGYSSEPFIAEAASRQMYLYMKRKQGFSMADVLRENLERGLINLGQKGAMIMRLLIRKAYMDAVIGEQEVKENASPNFSKGCSFVAFLKALFADCFRASILGCHPSNKVASPCTLEDAFKDATVRFTHFAKAVDGSAMTTRGMVMAFLRGAAIIGHNRQEDIHIAIPILLHKDRAIEEKSMSAMLIQIRRQQKSGTDSAYLIDQTIRTFDIFPLPDGRPYVTLVAELGVEAPLRSTSSMTTCEVNPARMMSYGHPRYSIRVYECTDQAWKVIHPDERACYVQILSTDDLWGDHPRQDATSLQLVRQQLPFWYRNAAWFSDGESDKAAELGPQQHEPVEVRSYEEFEAEFEGASVSTEKESMVVDDM